MNNKIPCGGFYLSDTLGVDENGRLGVNGGEPFKSLVTDGDGNVKWEDRLAYEAVTETVVLEEQTFTFSKSGSLMGATISKSLGIAVGEIVTVSWDGVSYNCTAKDFSGMVVIGNLGLIPNASEADTGEPFLIMDSGSGTQVATSDTSIEHVLSISYKSMVMKKIEPKYLGLFVFPVYSDDISGVSTSVSYDDVRAAFDSKIPIFAHRCVSYSGVSSEAESCKGIVELSNGLSFLFKNKTVNYLEDGTITETSSDV